MKKKHKVVLKTFILFVLTTIGAYFFTPLQDPINNFVDKLIHGEPYINIYIIRNYAVKNISEVGDFDNIFLYVNKDFQTVYFEKYKTKLPDHTQFGNSYIDMKTLPYHYLVFIENMGNTTAKNINILGKINAENINLLNVDAKIDMNTQNTGGLLPNERTFKLHIDNLKPKGITSFRFESDSLSEIDMDCSLKVGKCYKGVIDHKFFTYRNFPYSVSTSFYGNYLEISFPDYRNSKEGLFMFNPINKIWVPFLDIHKDLVMDIKCSYNQ